MRDGPEGRIATRAVAGTAPVDGVIAGPLYLVGGGDPTLSAARIAELAAAVKAAGVTTVQGGVVGDDSAFDHRIGSPDSDYRYDSELGGLLEQPAQLAVVAVVAVGAADAMVECAVVGPRRRPGPS